MRHFVIVGILVVLAALGVYFGVEASGLLPVAASAQAGSASTVGSIDWMWNLQVIADGFNLLNRTNISDVSPLCDPGSGTCNAGMPTAAFNARQFQFALKVNW